MTKRRPKRAGRCAGDRVLRGRRIATGHRCRRESYSGPSYPARPDSAPRGAGDNSFVPGAGERSQRVTPTARTKRTTVPPAIAQSLFIGERQNSPAPAIETPAGAFGGNTGALVEAPAGGDCSKVEAWGCIPGAGPSYSPHRYRDRYRSESAPSLAQLGPWARSGTTTREPHWRHLRARSRLAPGQSSNPRRIRDTSCVSRRADLPP